VAWGGDLRLAANTEDGSLNDQRSIFPHMNTTEVFTTDDISLYGHPEPLACPQEIKRNFIALYTMLRNFHQGWVLISVQIRSVALH
jgi:hypothetical protein